ncbi:MAG TPA: NAD-dependent epimerase/dehydratase family protein, partial [Chloroflexota bacterium]|nr:NAD-dependent epimerase/dehydratase family protein [Chloroflexota bacterium]
MRIFVAGATGVLGRRRVPLLVAEGHEVLGMTRTPAKVDELRGMGAQPVVVDALDSDAGRAAIIEAQPEAVVHHSKVSRCDTASSTVPAPRSARAVPMGSWCADDASQSSARALASGRSFTSTTRP